MNKVETSDIAKGAVAGLIGGLVASFVMLEFQTLLAKINESGSDGNEKEESSEPATTKAAEMIAERVLHHRLTKNEKKLAEPLMHYAMGATSGMIYGATAEIEPLSTLGAGIPFGTAVWLIGDEGVVPALGLAKPWTAYPLSTHAYALSSHLVYGLTTDLVRRTVRNLL